MKLVATRNELLRALSFVGEAVNRKAPNFAASCALLKVTGKDAAEVSAFDGFMSASAGLTLLSGTKGAFGLPAADLLERVRAMPDGSDITIAIADSRATMTSGKRKHTLKAAPATDLPPFPGAPKGIAFEIGGETLAVALHRVAYAMNTQPEGKFHGTFLRTDGKALRLDASNGSALATCEVPHNAKPIQACLDLRTAALLAKHAGAHDGPVALAFEDGRRMAASFGPRTFVSPLRLDVPPGWLYDGGVPEPAGKVNVLRTALIDALQGVAPAATEVACPVDLAIGKDSIVVTSAGDGGDARDDVDADGDVEASVRLSLPNTLAALGSIDADIVTLSIGIDLDPVFIRAKDAADVNVHIVMPLRKDPNR